MDETVLTIFFLKKPGNVIMEKWNMADSVNFICKEMNHYNSNG
jgi:hypothetical protein